MNLCACIDARETIELATIPSSEVLRLPHACSQRWYNAYCIVYVSSRSLEAILPDVFHFHFSDAPLVEPRRVVVLLEGLAHGAVDVGMEASGCGSMGYSS